MFKQGKNQQVNNCTQEILGKNNSTSKKDDRNTTVDDVTKKIFFNSKIYLGHKRETANGEYISKCNKLGQIVTGNGYTR